MKSLNFEFLRSKHPELANLGGFAEAYVYTDPASSLVKLRTFAEYMAAAIYEIYDFERPSQTNLFDMLSGDSFRSSVPQVVMSKFHIIRRKGNEAAHNSSTAGSAVLHMLVEEAYQLASWFHLSVSNGNRSEIQPYKRIPPTSANEESRGELKRQRKADKEKIAQQEALMAKLLRELEEERSKNEKLSEPKPEKELKKIRSHAQKVANELEFNEEETRKKLIDVLLTDAGWNVHDGDEVGIEVVVDGQATSTGEGRCDYVLYEKETGDALAVIEAKRASADPRKGKMQAKYYADALQKKSSDNKRPVIFYTNGYEIYIWDDAKKQPPRLIFGFYSKDSLIYCIHQRGQKRLQDIPFNKKIIDRDYQMEAVTRISERFDPSENDVKPHRKALLIQATGTGKTRVAMAICDRMTRAGWVKRILFLCDRKELRKQANNSFKEFLPDLSRVEVSSRTSKERQHSIYLATYPAMMKCFQTFDAGFFDLIIADESHRSIYNRYKPIFTYFDSYQVGLTATPLKFVFRNTYRLFECEDENPTFNYSYEQAINNQPAPYLTPFKVIEHSTKFLREGINYKDLTKEQREQLEEQIEDAENFESSKDDIGKNILNKDTDRAIIRNLMEKGLKNADGSRLGKTIVFARNHKHAVQINQLFDEMYPQYGGTFCQVIDNYEPRAEQLIDDFKDDTGKKDLTIAVSVDMLDTGIDVPPVVNLVMAKPVMTYSKFWQMIGRGTRLCKDLYGIGSDKKEFYIFDHWKNFERFSEEFTEVDPGQSKSLMQNLFEARIQLAETALSKQHLEGFNLTIKNLETDIRSLDERTIAVREKWKEKKAVEHEKVLREFAPATLAVLKNDIASLMQWRDLEKNEAAFRFDYLIAQLQEAIIRKSQQCDDLKFKLITQVSELQINLSQVAAKINVIEKVKAPEFYKTMTVKELEEVRIELRSLMKYRNKGFVPPPGEGLVLDVRDGDSKYNVIDKPKLGGQELVAYRERVESILKELFSLNPVLQKIKRKEPVEEYEIQRLDDMVLDRDPTVHIKDLPVQFPKAGGIEEAIRMIIGLDPVLVEGTFKDFMMANPGLTSHQMRFLAMLKDHISIHGTVEPAQLWEKPFDAVPGGADNFNEQQLDDLIEIINKL